MHDTDHDHTGPARERPLTAEGGERGSLAGSIPGFIRRTRRTADLSQRGLATRLGVSQSRVARWETGRTIPSVVDMELLLSVAGARTDVRDHAGSRVVPMRDDGVRDRASRRFPAHVDPIDRGWWMPPGSHLTGWGTVELAASCAAGDLRIGYDRGLWRSVLRALFGTPPDHPTKEELVDAARRRSHAHHNHTHDTHRGRTTERLRLPDGRADGLNPSRSSLGA